MECEDCFMEENEVSAIIVNNGPYCEISKEACRDLVNYAHAAHCCIYAKWDAKALNRDSLATRAAIYMQVRSDGMLGFPGGMVKDGETITDGLNREMMEEINFDVSGIPVGDQHHFASHVHRKKKFCMHFYVREVTMKEFLDIEKRTLDAEEFGSETFGMTRVPLFTYSDGLGGLPAFLRNYFVGNAKEQLLQFLLKFSILSTDEVSAALTASL